MGSTTATDSKLPPVVKRLENGEKTPICVIVVGMAGSGKTTLLTQLQRDLDRRHEESKLLKNSKFDKDQENDEEEDTDEDDDESPGYCVNLDPATLDTPYDVSIDIRDTVDYKQVMQQHKLGPNGAIMTSLNLFTTKFDQVLSILEKRAYPEDTGEKPVEYILVDTPGQIEAFTWSASGQIISESLASSFPSVLCFVVDTFRCASSPNTFMSNMLYACSMMYRTRLPLVVCFNKTDVVSHEFCIEWMRDFESFQEALDETPSGFYGSLTRSLSLVLEEFYSNFANAVGVSAVTGEGMDEFWSTVEKAARQDFVADYIQDLRYRIEEKDARDMAIARMGAKKLQKDVEDKENDS